MKKIYCAGPLFNPKEREHMQEIANRLESAGYKVFLPHRDGIELAKLSSVLIKKGYSLDQANTLLAKAIFEIDTFQVAANDGIVVNLNGRVPDEGAMVEAGIAWTLGKQIVVYKNDSRCLTHGLDNPLVAGLSNFKVASDIDEVTKEFDRLFSDKPKNESLQFKANLSKRFERGEQLYTVYSNRPYGDLDLDTFIRLLTA